MGGLSNEQREQQQRRLRAARELRGHSQQTAFGRLVKPYGVRAYGELERGDKPLLAAERAILSRVLELPERWFTAPLEELLAEPPPESLAVQLERIAGTLTDLERRTAPEALVSLILRALGDAERAQEQSPRDTEAEPPATES